MTIVKNLAPHRPSKQSKNLTILFKLRLPEAIVHNRHFGMSEHPLFFSANCFPCQTKTCSQEALCISEVFPEQSSTPDRPFQEASLQMNGRLYECRLPVLLRWIGVVQINPRLIGTGSWLHSRCYFKKKSQVKGQEPLFTKRITWTLLRHQNKRQNKTATRYEGGLSIK